VKKNINYPATATLNVANSVDIVTYTGGGDKKSGPQNNLFMSGKLPNLADLKRI
jgi:hypothetical protein